MRLGLVDGQFVPFPTHDELEASELDLIVSGTRDAVLMIEGFSRELREDRMLEAISEAHRYVRELCDLQQELADKVGVKRWISRRRRTTVCMIGCVTAFYDRLKEAKRTEGKQARAEAVAAVKSGRRCWRSFLSARQRADGCVGGRFGAGIGGFSKVVARSGSSAWCAIGFSAARDPTGATRKRCGRLCAKWICCRACTVRHCSNAARRSRW